MGREKRNWTEMWVVCSTSAHTNVHVYVCKCVLYMVCVVITSHSVCKTSHPDHFHEVPLKLSSDFLYYGANTCTVYCVHPINCTVISCK